MRRNLFTVLIMLAAVVWGPWALAQGPGEGEVMLLGVGFEESSVTGWQLDPGWDVQVVESGHALVGNGHTWATPVDVEFTGDWRLTLRLMLVQGRIHLNYRVNHTGRYFIGFEAGRTDLHKQYWPDTFMGPLAESTGFYALNTWHTVDISGEGSTVRMSVDGQMLWTYTDPEPLVNGWFAFETLEDSQAYVDDIMVFGTAPAEDQASTGLVWVRTGGPLGGLGYDIRMRPDAPDTMFVTDAWAGVFTSTDGGTNWQPANNGITTRAGETGDAIPVFCLTISPHDANTIWIGTQNTRGIYRSTDGGASWERRDNGVVEREGITFRGFTVDPHNPDVVYAAAELASWVWAGDARMGREFDMVGGVVYRTTDGGENWQAIWRGDNLARYVLVDPRDSNVLYVSTGIFDREAANSDPDRRLPGGEGVLKSTDGGQSWQLANEGLGNFYVGTLEMHPVNPDILLAGTGNNQYYGSAGVYITTDGATTWQAVRLGEDTINAVAFAPSDPNIAYAGSSAAIYRSEDGGMTWQRVAGDDEDGGWGPPGVRAGFPIDFQVDPRDPNRLFANNYGGGNFLSSDGGYTWIDASRGYTGAQVRAVTVGADGVVYAAARSGLFASPNGGDTWVGRNFWPASAMEWNAVAVDPVDTQHILASNNWNGTLSQSHDAGQSWQHMSQHAGEGQGWRVIAFASDHSGVVYAGRSAFYSAGTFDDTMPAGGVYVSHDGGSTWFPANDATSAEANVIGLVVVDPATVYAATGNTGVLKTVDGGASWSALPLPLHGNLAALSVAIHPQQPETVYAGVRFGGLWRSMDAGQSWQLAGAGLNPEASISSIVFDPTDPAVMFVADRMSGVYRSTDGGQTWLVVNEGLRTRAVNALAFTPDGLQLYAATEGEGVFRLDLGQ